MRALIDGGVYANNPAERAIGFAAAKLRVPTEELTLLSIGAGAPPFAPPKELLEEGVKMLDWGIRQWVVKSPNLLLKVLFDGSVAASHFSSRGMLGERYHRLQPVLSEDVDLADYNKIPLLMATADALDLTATKAWIKTWVK